MKAGGGTATSHVYYVPPKQKRGTDQESGRSHATPKRVAPVRGMGRFAGSSPAGTVQYYEPPPPPRAMVMWTNAEVQTWLDAQHPAYVETVSEFAERNGITIEAMVRRQARTPCPECGNDGSPTTFHRWNCPIAPEVLRAPPPRSFKKVEPVPPLDEDDDLPF